MSLIVYYIEERMRFNDLKLAVSILLFYLALTRMIFVHVDQNDLDKKYSRWQYDLKFKLFEYIIKLYIIWQFPLFCLATTSNFASPPHIFIKMEDKERTVLILGKVWLSNG